MKSKIYILYNLLYVHNHNTGTLIGQKPKQISGIGIIKDIYYGYIEDCNDLYKIHEYNPMVVSKKAIDGFPIVDLDEMLITDPMEPTNSESRPFTDEEFECKRIAQKFLKDFKIMMARRVHFSSCEALIMTLHKRLSIAEDILATLANKEINNIQIGQDNIDKIKSILATRSNALASIPAGIKTFADWNIAEIVSHGVALDHECITTEKLINDNE
ncbi:MAG: hypothetical protein GY804_09325 [Alphaproteobacteria bacterium]|nr:hypothetical protein [Alphaproteobacteria bacterium]